MIIKDITGKQISTTGTILPFKKNIFPNKIDKTIEIVIVPKLADITANQKNVGIVLDEKLILKILSKHYRNVSITEIITKNDLKKLALRKPDLVFSGVKYFYFADGIIWLNDYLKLHDILYIASDRTALHNEHDKSIAKKIIQKANITFEEIKKKRTRFVEKINQDRPSIGTILAHSNPYELNGNLLVIKIYDLPKFSVGNLERNNQVIEKYFEDHYGVSLKLRAIISDGVDPENNNKIIEKPISS